MSLFSTDIAIDFSSTKHIFMTLTQHCIRFMGLDTGWLTLMPQLRRWHGSELTHASVYLKILSSKPGLLFNTKVFNFSKGSIEFHPQFFVMSLLINRVSSENFIY